MGILLLFFGPFYGFNDSTVEDMTGNRERERGGVTRSKVKPWSAAEPLHMGRALYQLS